ncbi:hypothetical protein RJ639_042107 [Escallonia herrerae]|uniref:Alpha/beta hydrolase fold-3 domain-containing protein n=1 Tax=Escallonia herrerae TaxID=1293975 RepID=A0AA88WG50_9ASTE|nr:hypothetical protein RJ639_042107 [Escallonia herrerae]
MASTTDEITHEFPPFFRVYKDGRIERYPASPYVEPELDPTTGVGSKDVVISSEPSIKARVFIPRINEPDEKLLLVLHCHGGAFCVGSPFNAVTHNFLTSFVSQIRAIVVSVDYRLAPENPLPIPYEDSWASMQWVAAHFGGEGPEPWINQHADMGRVFLAGESAGGTIAHNIAVRAGAEGTVGFGVRGLIIVHPFFANEEPDELITYLYPTCGGLFDDPILNPDSDPDLSKLGCSRVFVCVAEQDWLKPRGLSYYEILKRSGYGGTVEFVETEGENHCFHVFNPTCDKALALNRALASFINQD